MTSFDVLGADNVTLDDVLHAACVTSFDVLGADNDTLYDALHAVCVTSCDVLRAVSATTYADRSVSDWRQSRKASRRAVERLVT